MSFEEYGLSPEILEAIGAMGFETPTPVQAEVIPRLLKNRGDMVALAQTGTGKTAAFGLPILNMLNHELRAPQALVLCPTRELCVQITRDLEAFAARTQGVRVVAVYGGASIQDQLRALNRGAQIVVATPGRMHDILRRGKADLSGVERVILDEADEMLNMGFQEDLEAILGQTPDTAHTLLFSATMPHHVAAIARKHMHKPEEITVGHRNAGAETVSHECYVVRERDRYAALKRISDYYPDMYGIVFCRTRLETQAVADWLIRDGYNADALHGDLSQAQRDMVMKKFRARSLQLLVATDVAARGLDVNDLTHVINYNLPDELGSYTHRSGRTGRAGKKGVSIVIVNMREKGRAHHIERLTKTKFAYPEIPTGRAICEAQLLSHVARMKSVELDHTQIDPFLPEIYEALEGMDGKEVIKRFVSLEFEILLKYYRGAEDLQPGKEEGRPPARDGRSRRERASGPGRRDAPVGARLAVNIGSADGLNPRKLTGWISRAGGHNVRVGRIEIMEHRALFEVPVKDARALARALDKNPFDGRAVRVEDAGADRGRKPSGRPPRGKPAFKRKSAARGKSKGKPAARGKSRGAGPAGA